MLTKNFGLEPSLAEDPGVSFEMDSYGGRTPVSKQNKLRETVVVIHADPDTQSTFDDTFRDIPSVRQQRLKESQPGSFARGVPTNDKSSSQNYNQDRVKIIDGEHKTLLSLGKISEAYEADEHDAHIREHRLMLADENLSETQRGALLEHISDHYKKHGKKLKAVNEAKKARNDIHQSHGYRAGVGQSSHALAAPTDDVIPQDSQVDKERKRTAGNMAMESRMHRFDRAVKISSRR